MPKTSLQVFKAKPPPPHFRFFILLFWRWHFFRTEYKNWHFYFANQQNFFLTPFIVNPINMQYKCRLSGTGFRQFPGRPWDYAHHNVMCPHYSPRKNIMVAKGGIQQYLHSDFLLKYTLKNLIYVFGINYIIKKKKIRMDN